MPRSVARIPHPSSALVEKVGDLVVISREWYRKLDVAVSRGFDEMSDAELLSIVNGADEQKSIN